MFAPESCLPLNYLLLQGVAAAVPRDKILVEQCMHQLSRAYITALARFPFPGRRHDVFKLSHIRHSCYRK